MERRSNRNNKEYKKLRLALISMGYYEEGMSIQEMREVVGAVQLSIKESEANFPEADMQQAIRDSQLDCAPVPESSIRSSTILSGNQDATPSDSIDEQSGIVAVQAQVHHTMDWSPTTSSSAQKRPASCSIETDVPSNTLDVETSTGKQLKPDSKRPSRVTYMKLEEETASCSVDMNICQEFEPRSSYSSYLQIPYRLLDDDDSYNSLEDVDSIDNSADYSIEMSASGSHEIRGPVSQRRIRDSGLIESNEPPHTTSSLALSTLSPPSTSAGSSNQQISPPVHPIHVPVSVRITHDSDLNLSTEAPNSPSVLYLDEQSTSSQGNASNTTENSNDSNQDLEQ